MKLSEYEAKNILKGYGIRIPHGKLVSKADEAKAAAEEIAKPTILKSQIPVAGRGKAGGIVSADNATQAQVIAGKLIGSLVKGIRVNRLLVEEKLNINEQLYASIAVDRQAKSYVALASTSGGVDIEAVAAESPDRISRCWIDVADGFDSTQAEGVISSFNLGRGDTGAFAEVLSMMYLSVLEYDAELVEINPLAKTSSGELVAADARMIIDDNAIFRHPEFQERSLLREEDTPLEAEARRQQLTYVDLDGDIGIIGNGAGLVMATIDIVQLLGGQPANFLDIGGGAQPEIIKNSLKLVMSKPEVRAVLINILGGITRCDLVARGIIGYLKESTVKKPIAVRMIGTNEKEGEVILRQVCITSYCSIEEAAESVLRL
jgi:succinyl-CoA synthetase beta subunit